MRVPDAELRPEIALQRRRRHSIEEKLRVVQETLLPGASVARIARAHEVNANQVFLWRKQYQHGLLGATVNDNRLVPVRVVGESGDSVREHPKEDQHRHEAPVTETPSGTIEIKLAKAQLRIDGAVDSASLRVILEYLLG